MRRNFLLIATMMALSFSSLAQEKGGEVGNPISEINIITTAKDKEIRDRFSRCHPLESSRDAGGYQKTICVSYKEKNGNQTYGIFNQKEFIRLGLASVTQQPISSCYNDDGHAPNKCRSANGFYEIIPEKVLKKAEVKVKELQYCEYNDEYKFDITCFIKGSNESDSIIFDSVDFEHLEFPSKFKYMYDSEKKNFKNCIVNEHDRVRCSAERPNGDKTDIIMLKDEAVSMKLELTYMPTCEVVTAEFAICHGSTYDIDQKSLGLISKIKRAIGKEITNNKCTGLEYYSVYCNDLIYNRRKEDTTAKANTKVDDSSRASVKEATFILDSSKKTKTSSK